MQVKTQQLEPDMEQWTSSKLEKEYIKAVYCHPTYLTYMQSTSCKMLGWMNLKLESRLMGGISETSDMQMTPTYGRKWRGTKVSLDEGELEWKKTGLKLNIQKTKIMASGPITSWQMEKQWKQCQTLFFGGAPKSLQMVIAAMKLKDAYTLEEKLWPT